MNDSNFNFFVLVSLVYNQIVLTGVFGVHGDIRDLSVIPYLTILHVVFLFFFLHHLFLLNGDRYGVDEDVFFYFLLCPAFTLTLLMYSCQHYCHMLLHLHSYSSWSQCTPLLPTKVVWQIIIISLPCISSPSDGQVQSDSVRFS